MSATTILNVIQHYQRSIEHSQDDEGRLLHCINKLYRLPVKVEHLQETGVGKTVNSLRKYNGEIGVAAKALVTKWKAMVAAEEEPAEANNCEINDDDDDDDDDGKNRSDHVSSDLGQNDRNSTAINMTNANPTNDRQSNNNNHTKKGSSEHQKSKSHREEKANKHTEHSSSKHKRHTEQGENDLQNGKRIKNDEHDNENKKRDNHRHKTSHGKSDSQRDEKQQSSCKDGKTTSSKQTSHHHRNGGGDVKEKRDGSQQRDEKRNELTGSSKHHTNDNEEVTTRKRGDSGKNRSSSKEQDRKERSKESKHDKSKSSKDSSNRDKHHKSTTSHSSSSNNKADNTSGNSSKRKRHHDSDSNDASSPTKTKAAKSPKLPMTPTNVNENEGDNVDGIDSSMGANFADVLGMLMMPTKKSKKLLNNNKSPTVPPSKNISSEKPSSSNSTTSKDNKMEYKPSSISASTSTKSFDSKPELLSSSTKLAPLDPSIALELPTISANYKPLPHNKTVMECVYRNSGIVNNPPKPPVRTLTDAEAISHGISSKTMRTKIYSGIRTGQMLQVPSLFDLCIRILQKNIDALEYTGGVPFDVLRPVLERATPIQLLTFEEYNPYLMEDSDCLWQIHVQRSFRSKKREEMESWREMFLRCEEEKERKLSSLTETIKKSQKVIAAPIRKTQLAFVDSMVKPPRNVLRKQEQYGTKEKLVATPAARVASLSIVTPNAAKVGDTRLRVAGAVRDTAQTVANPARGKKAPLMAKTLQFIRGRHKR